LLDWLVMTLDLEPLRRLAMSDQGFVFDPISGHSFTLNSTGMRVLQLLKSGEQPDSIAARLQEEFELDPVDDPVRDVEDFVRRLREHHLIG
jgi:PqqD family protein of HPr-rel-A system